MIPSEYNEVMYEEFTDYICDLEYVVSQGVGNDISLNEYGLFTLPIQENGPRYPVTTISVEDVGYEDFASRHKNITGYEIFTFYRFIVEQGITFDAVYFEEMDDNIFYI